MSIIRVDYANARNQARKLQRASEDCETIIKQFDQLVAQVPNCWEGVSADAFIVALKRQMMELRVLKEEYSSLGSHIRRVADELEAKERELKAAMRADQAAASSMGGSSGFGGGGGGGRGF